MTKIKLLTIMAIAITLGATEVPAQRGSGGRTSSRNSRQGYPRQNYNNRSISIEPQWEIDKEFSHDIFTFTRVQYNLSNESRGRNRFGRGFNRSAGYSGGKNSAGVSWRWVSGHGWATDFPDSDLNFSYRLHQLTSLEVNPIPVTIELTNPELCNYPFLYMADPGYLNLNKKEIECLRKYLLNGGFLMMDDFWGENEWANVYGQIKQVLPESEPVELALEHPIFHCVFELEKKPQICNAFYALNSKSSGITWERPDAKSPHYMAVYDAKGRMMVIMCHNTDTGDGWEREGEDEWFFHEFSETQAYPLGINIVFYAMTH